MRILQSYKIDSVQCKSSIEKKNSGIDGIPMYERQM